MGLDMFLTGRKYLSKYDKGYVPLEHCGRKAKAVEFDLGYWRKHPNLHGYIVNTFAEGKDECQEIPLGKEDIQKIINAVNNDDLPHTKGFFFGVSGDVNSSDKEEREWALKEKQRTLEVFSEAIDFLNEQEGGYPSVYYSASW